MLHCTTSCGTFNPNQRRLYVYTENVEVCNIMVASAWAIDASDPSYVGQAVSKLCCQLDTFDSGGGNAAQGGTAGLSGSVWGRRSRSSFVSAVALSDSLYICVLVLVPICFWNHTIYHRERLLFDRERRSIVFCIVALLPSFARH